MHVAICLWGLLRSLRFTLHSFHINILKPLHNQGHTFDIYVHTYNFSGSYVNKRNHETSAVHINVTDWKLLRPNYIYIENQDEFDAKVNYEMYETQGDPWHNNYSSFKNHMRALNSLHHVASAVESVVQSNNGVIYDSIVFVRPDVDFVTQLPLYLLQEYPDTLFLPDFHRSCFGNEYNDRMAMGSYQVALTYGKKFQFALDYSLSHLLHAEKITHAYLEQAQIIKEDKQNPNHSVNIKPKVVEMPFRFRRIRASGEVHERDIEAVHPKEQAYLEAKGDLFVGDERKRTMWPLRWLYNFLEMITLYRVYWWNHDDHGNVFCHPHDRITYEKMLSLEEKYHVNTLGVVSKKNQKLRGNKNERAPAVMNHHLHHHHNWSERQFKCQYMYESKEADIEGVMQKTSYIVPYDCHISRSTATQ